MRRAIVIATASLLVAGLGCGRFPSPDRHTVAEHIWGLEARYNDGYLQADHGAVLAHLHDRFLGWPGDEPAPVDRAAMAAFLARRYPKPATWTIAIERQGIEVLDDVAVTHYTVHARWSAASGAEHRRSSKVTHTWVRDGSRWLMLGGMSAGLQPPFATERTP